MTKTIWASKTFWANLIAAVIGGLEVTRVIDYLTPEQQTAFAVGMAVLNIILRYVTTKPVTLK